MWHPTDYPELDVLFHQKCTWDQHVVLISPFNFSLCLLFITFFHQIHYPPLISQNYVLMKLYHKKSLRKINEKQKNKATLCAISPVSKFLRVPLPWVSVQSDWQLDLMLRGNGHRGLVWLENLSAGSLKAAHVQSLLKHNDILNAIQLKLRH